MLPPVQIESGLPSDSKSNTFNFELNGHLVVKLRLFGSSYCHTLYALTRLSKSKNQLEHGQEFKDPQSSTGQISSERRVLDFESEASQRNRFNPY